jgi:hypothetical protein
MPMWFMLAVFCDGKAIHAVAEYQRSFPTVDYQTKEYFLQFTRYREIPVHIPTFVLQLSLSLMKTSVGNKNIVLMAEHNPRAITRNTVRRLDDP